MELKVYIGEQIKSFRKMNGLTQTDLAEKLGTTKQTISRYEKGIRKADQDVLFALCDIFGVSIDDFFPRTDTQPAPQVVISKNATTTPPEATDELVQAINDKVVQLTTEDKKSVLAHASALLEKKKASERPVLDIQVVSETFKVYYTSAAKAGPTGFGYDDYEMDFAYTDQEPPRHDIATMVDGDSMNPDYQDGDILYLRDYGTSQYDGEECVVVIDDKSYFKKIYTTDTGLRLVSTNPDKDTYPDLEIDFPPTDGSHIKIFTVVGSFTPVEKEGTDQIQ